MRIAINGYFLQQPGTGTGEHLYYLLEGLDAVDNEHRYLVLYPRLTSSRVVRVPPLGDQFTIQEVTDAGARLGLRLGKIWWEQVGVKRACAAHGADLLHSPYFASPLNPSIPTVVTVHDVIPILLPAYRDALHTRLYMQLVARAARQAKAVLTVSQASKEDIVSTLGIPAERIHVTYNAVDASFTPVSDQSVLDGVRDSYGIGGDFLLYFGGFDRRKNVDRIVQAYATARTRFGKPHQLVIAGSMHLVGHRLYPDPRPLVAKLDLERDVVVTGRISEDEKAVLYSAATVFVFPSLYEGFGMPVLEAMACGTPTITSNVSSLPEVAGDAALLVEPTSVEAIAEAMVRAVNESGLREDLRARGLQRAKQFSWEESAARTLEVYRQVVE